MKKVFSIAIASLISLSATPRQTQSALPNLEPFHGNDLGIAKIFTSPHPLRTILNKHLGTIAKAKEQWKCVILEAEAFQPITCSILKTFREKIYSGNNLDIVEFAKTHTTVMGFLAYYSLETLDELCQKSNAAAQNMLNETLRLNVYLYGINVELAMHYLQQCLPQAHHQMLCSVLSLVDELLCDVYAIPKNENVRPKAPNWILEDAMRKKRTDEKWANTLYLMRNPSEKSKTLSNLLRGVQELEAQNVESIVYNQPSAAPDTIHQSEEEFSGNFELGLVSKKSQIRDPQFELGLVSKKSQIRDPQHDF